LKAEIFLGVVKKMIFYKEYFMKEVKFNLQLPKAKDDILQSVFLERAKILLVVVESKR